jgi:UDP-glucose 4-epimerase
LTVERIVVTGATTPLGRLLLERLREEPGVEKVIGTEPRASNQWMDGVELVAFEPDDQELARFLEDQGIDTVIHAGLTPTRSGNYARTGPADVIGTMRLCAAMSSPRAKVRSLVLVSSSAAYPIDSYAPLLHREDDATDKSELEPAAAILEAEEYARDIAQRLGHLDVAILRLAELAGVGLCGSLGSALLQTVVPSPIGYDPHVQWLHAEDAIDAIVFAARLELAGVYNVASDGVVRWSEAREFRGGLSLPVLPFEAGPLAGLMQRAGLPYIPEGSGAILRFGSAVDIAKLRSAGWEPCRDQRECVLALER